MMFFTPRLSARFGLRKVFLFMATLLLTFGTAYADLQVCGLNSCGPTRVVQYIGTAPWLYLEPEARQKIASLRGVANDTLNVYWSRGEIRAYMYLRLLQMANAPVGTLSSQEQEVVKYYTDLINDRRVRVADAAVALYDSWSASPCTFEVPVGDPNAYLNQTGIYGICHSILAGLVTTPPPPTAEQFTAWADGAIREQEFKDWGKELSSFLTVEQAQHAAAFEFDTAFGGIAEGTAYLNAMHAAVANVDSSTVVTATEMDVATLWFSTLNAIAISQGTDLALNPLLTVATPFILENVFPQVLDVEAVVTESSLGIAVDSWETIIGPAIGAGVIIAFESWKQATYLDIPAKLQTMQSDVRNSNYDLAYYAGDVNRRQLIVDAIVESSMPDFLPNRLGDTTYGAAPAVDLQPLDPVFKTDTATSVSPTFTSFDWNVKPVTTSVRDGWFVQQQGNALRYSSSLNYINDQNERWHAWLHGSTFLAERVSAYAGQVHVERAFNSCGKDAPNLLLQNVALGYMCVFALGDNTSTFNFPIVQGQLVEIAGQIRKVAYVNPDGAGNTLSFAVSSPFAEASIPDGSSLHVLAHPGDKCFTESTITSNSSPDCIQSDTITVGNQVAPASCPLCGIDSKVMNASSTVKLVTKVELTVTAPSLTILTTDPVPAITPSYSGFVDGDTAASLTTPPTCTTNYTQGSGPAFFYMHCQGPSDDGRYHIKYVDGYILSQLEPMIITASSATVTYGEPVPAITPSFAGEPASSVITSCTTTYTQGSPPGTYPTSCSGYSTSNIFGTAGCGISIGSQVSDQGPCIWATDFSISTIDGTLTVKPAPLAITASNDSMIYGSTPPVINPMYSGFVNGESAADLTTQPTCSITAASASAVGSYSTTCSGAVDANYVITYQPGTFEVKPAPLTITASSGSMIAGGTPPVIEPSYSGFVNSESATSLTTQPTCSTAATSGSAVGTYSSSCMGAVATNYTMTYVPGVVTVDYDQTVLGSDPTKYNQGVSVPLTIEIVDANGTNLSSSAVTLSLTNPGVSPDPSPGVQPTGAFSFDGNKYHLVLDTKGYPSGTYTLSYTASGDPGIHTITFNVY